MATCWEYQLQDPPSVSNLQLQTITFGQMTLGWNCPASNNGCEVQRDDVDLVNTTQKQYTDAFNYSLGARHTYSVRVRAGNCIPPANLPQRTTESENQAAKVPQWTNDGPWQEISVVPQTLTPSQDQVVDSRLDTRCVANTYLNFQFGNGIYRGGLFVGNSGDPSNVARSFLQFDLTGIPGQMQTNDRLWASSFNIYYTRSLADSTSTAVGCQFVADDSMERAKRRLDHGSRNSPVERHGNRNRERRHFRLVHLAELFPLCNPRMLRRRRYLVRAGEHAGKQPRMGVFRQERV